MSIWNGNKPLDGALLFNECRTHGSGGMSRFKITVDLDRLNQQQADLKQLHLRIKNEESPLLRPIYISGPYSFYCDLRPINYDEDVLFNSKETIHFVEDLKPDETFKADLLLNESSKLNGTTNKYCWIVDVITQLAVITFPTLTFSIRIGTSRAITKGRKSSNKLIDDKFNALEILEWDEKQLWNLPPIFPEKPAHLVILTHGIFSNIGCDMLYMKDKIEKIANKVEPELNTNVIVRGCMDNMGKSAHGIHYLGKRVGKYVIQTVNQLRNENINIGKISFIGHSLGGPTQSMAIHYINELKPGFFDPKRGGIQPANFIALASPMIGVIGDFPFYLSVPLDIGALGITGRDLNLKKTPGVPKDGLHIEKTKDYPKLIMEIIPQSPAKEVFAQFFNRTVYANVINDGIVPLRTAALLYLDWKSLAKVSKIKNVNKKVPMLEMNEPMERSETTISESNDDISATANNNGNITEIPTDDLDKKATVQFMLTDAIKHSRRKHHKFGLGQTVNTENNDKEAIDETKFKDAPDEASAVLSALSVLTAPVPSQDYIKNPVARADSIIHDKLYTPKMLPPPHYIDRSTLKRIIYPNENVNRIQERIARVWQETMDWRKVLVRIQPDSHNNIVVRRRFTNLYGNIAVTHMAQEHFGTEACRKYSISQD